MVYVGLTSNKPFMFIIMKEYAFSGVSGTDLRYLRLLKFLTILIVGFCIFSLHANG